jgi:hypothetical protein
MIEEEAMVKHLWQVQIQQLDGTGLILLDAQGRVLQTNLKGQECLTLFTEARLGQPLPQLGQWPLQELLGIPFTLGVEMCHEIVLTKLPGQLFEVGVQPVFVGYQNEGWLLRVREVAQGEELPSFCAPPVRSSVFHWPPASPLTSNLP